MGIFENHGLNSPRNGSQSNMLGCFLHGFVGRIGATTDQLRRVIEEERMEINGADTILVISSVEGSIEGKRTERGIGGKLASTMVQGVSVSMLKRNMDFSVECDLNLPEWRRPNRRVSDFGDRGLRANLRPRSSGTDG